MLVLKIFKVSAYKSGMCAKLNEYGAASNFELNIFLNCPVFGSYSSICIEIYTLLFFKSKTITHLYMLCNLHK